MRFSFGTLQIKLKNFVQLINTFHPLFSSKIKLRLNKDLASEPEVDKQINEGSQKLNLLANNLVTVTMSSWLWSCHLD